MKTKKSNKKKTVKTKKTVPKKNILTKRISTGITPLNKILNGGYLRGTSILLMAPPRMGKSMFSTHFITAGKEDIGVYVTTNDVGENVKKRINNFDSKFKEVKVVDAYSSSTQKNTNGIIPVGKSNLSDISVSLSEIWKAYPNKTLRCVIDSVSNLIIHNSINEVANFLEDVISKFRAREGVIILVIEKGMHENEIYVMLEALTDSTIELEDKTDGRFIRLRGFDVESEKLLEYVPYRITSKGVELK